MYAAEKKKGPSWGIVILLIVLFWPVGLFLLFRKLSSDKTAALKNSKGFTVFGCILIALGFIYLGMGASGTIQYESGEVSTVGSMMPMILFFILGGIGLVITGRIMKKNGLKYRRYIGVVVNHEEASVVNIASAVGVSVEQAMKDLKKMIELGYFENAYFDEGRCELVMPRRAKPEVMERTSYNGGVGAQIGVESRTRSITCRHCGANNRVIGNETNECEYCGAPLS